MNTYKNLADKRQKWFYTFFTLFVIGVIILFIDILLVLSIVSFIIGLLCWIPIFYYDEKIKKLLWG